MTDPDGSSAAFRVDPYRFMGPTLRSLVTSSIPDEPSYGEIPWTPPAGPLAAARVALLTTAGLFMKGDRPFDLERERREPLWGDPSWRRLRADATAENTDVAHLHIKTDYIRRDLNVALPLDRLRELVADGVVGSVADSHYSVMGYQGENPARIAKASGEEIVASLRGERVDLLLLAPV
jgi:D-proline reductase (dithiol) PrdB